MAVRFARVALAAGRRCATRHCLQSRESTTSSRPIIHLGRLDDGRRLVAPPQPQLVDRVPRDDRRELLVADLEPDLCEQPFTPHFLDDAAQPVPAAE